MAAVFEWREVFVSSYDALNGGAQTASTALPDDSWSVQRIILTGAFSMWANPGPGLQSVGRVPSAVVAGLWVALTDPQGNQTDYLLIRQVLMEARSWGYDTPSGPNLMAQWITPGWWGSWDAAVRRRAPAEGMRVELHGDVLAHQFNETYGLPPDQTPVANHDLSMKVLVSKA